uniref:Uncharacterized protein n=1 Tax=Oryza rufipogon TaxID=4529 RepID=A0A0E0R3N4_ORYRU
MELLPLLLLLLLRIVASAPASPLATALFVLGDSTASCAATTLPLNLSLTSSSGNCLFPSAHRLLPDLLAAKMGLPSPPLITTLNGTATEVARGVNFAGEDGGRGAIFRLGAGYSARVAARLAALRPRLAGADVVFCDIYKGIMDIITHPARYGFDETRKACCGLGPFGGTVGCLTKEMVCPTPQRHVWWDLYSPTEVVTSLLTNWSWSAPSHSNTTICRPITLEMLTGHISLISPSMF